MTEIRQFEVGTSKGGRPMITLSAVTDPVPALDDATSAEVADAVRAQCAAGLEGSAELSAASAELDRLETVLTTALAEQRELLSERELLKEQRYDCLRSGKDVHPIEKKLRANEDATASVDARVSDLRPMVSAAATIVHDRLSSLLAPVDRPVVEISWDAVCEALEQVYLSQVQEKQQTEAWLTAKNEISRQIDAAAQNPEELRRFLDTIQPKEIFA